MPPKKEATTGAGAEGVIKGFTEKETRLLAAAFVATDGTGKIDYKIMAELTGHTEGTLKKFYPPIKRKVAEIYPSFAGGEGGAAAAAAKPAPAKANGSKKRKASDDENGDGASDENGKATKGKGRGGKRTKKNKKDQEEAQVSEGDGM
ncbi:hypothetical protein K491DRAFT_589910 [Lophiostoma macrostomum CBS 122681]|uniref:Uncharacterized protein n=1 Tax=Lophiostoma macrostomum CBS 122681 TaxID=1314788 RepID=A0A6A6TN63_9PLEO|nr:hypothetical protein K491DRAFT_589910 [Lophiostoma macrostomum CBS 122681]